MARVKEKRKEKLREMERYGCQGASARETVKKRRIDS